MPDVAVIERFNAAHARLLEQVEAIVAAEWARLTSWRDPDAEQFITRVGRVVPVAQTRVAAMVDATVARLTDTAPVGVPAELVTDVRGVPLTEEYLRPFIEIWSKVNREPLTDLVANAGDRVVKMATMDTQVGMRNAMTHVASVQPRVVGYRRVLKGKSCKFCAAASTRRYHKAQLMPLHAHCDCGIAPIIGTSDPGEVVNRRTLENLKAQGPEYWKRNGFVDADGAPIPPTEVPSSLAVVTDHDELGPLLNA